MRMQQDIKKEDIEKVDKKRKLLRRISWKTDYSTLPADELAALHNLFPKVKENVQALKNDVKQQLDSAKSARKLRTTVRSKDPVCFISLHLSSHGQGVGAFGRGWFTNSDLE